MAVERDELARPHGVSGGGQDGVDAGADIQRGALRRRGLFTAEQVVVIRDREEIETGDVAGVSVSLGRGARAVARAGVRVKIAEVDVQ